MQPQGQTALINLAQSGIFAVLNRLVRALGAVDAPHVGQQILGPETTAVQAAQAA